MSLPDESAPAFSLRSTAGREASLADGLETGPALVVTNRGHWCSFCAEQLRTVDDVAEDLRFNDGLSILPVVTSELPRLVEMRDRFDFSFRLLADPDGAVAEQYAGTEQTSHGLTAVVGTYLVDTDGVVRYERVAENVTDRTYGNHPVHPARRLRRAVRRPVRVRGGATRAPR
jgi:peroxiredoxin